MNFLGRLKLACNATRWDDYLRSWLSGDSMPEDGISVVDDKALKYSAVFGCCRALAETFASTPFVTYKKETNGDKTKVTDLGVYRIFHEQPNTEMSAYNLAEMMLYQLNLGGNFTSQVLRSAAGEPVGLNPYLYTDVEIDRSEKTGKITYTITTTKGGVTTETPKTKPEIFHVPGLSINGLVGLSPISYAAGGIRLGLTYEQFNTNYYNNGAFPSGVFEHPKFLNDEAYKRLKADLHKKYQGLLKAGKPMLLEDGLQFKGFTITPIDSQLLESKKFQIEEICRIYRVPLHLVQNLDKATNNNIEQQSLEFVMYTMLPWFKRVESAINSQLLTAVQRREGYFAEYNLAGLLRGDTKTMAEAFAKGRQWGWLSVNDIRRLLNMNAIGPKGDIYLTPLNMVSADEDTTAANAASNQQLLDSIHELIETRG